MAYTGTSSGGTNLTEKQAEAIAAVAEHGSMTAAAKALGIDRTAVQHRLKYAGKKGHGPMLEDNLPLTGTSIMTGADGQVRVRWDKRNRGPMAPAEVAAEILGVLKGSIKPVRPPARTRRQYAGARGQLAVLPIFDLHMGMFASQPETGHSWDSRKAVETITGAVSRLVEASPEGADCLVLFGGDLCHTDGLDAVTPKNKNPLDASQRYGDVLRATAEMCCLIVDLCLARFGKVSVRMVCGNHDITTTYGLAMALEMRYAGSKRFDIERPDNPYQYFKHGKNLVGLTHGHLANPKMLPMVMAEDAADLWGQTQHRWFVTGHRHSASLLEAPGCVVEGFRNMPPTDAWAHSKGYRSRQTMHAVILDSEHGETARHTISAGGVK